MEAKKRVSQSSIGSGSQADSVTTEVKATLSRSDRKFPIKPETIIHPRTVVFGGIVSPYNAGELKCWDMKLHSNKVFVPWYRRYTEILPEGQKFDFQPYEEIQRRDEDIALQHYYGRNYRQACVGLTDGNCNLKRKATLRQYNKMKAKAESKAKEKKTGLTEEEDIRQRSYSIRTIVASNRAKAADYRAAFGPTDCERDVMEPVVDYFRKLHIKRIRFVRGSKLLKEGSKWTYLKDPIVKEKLKLMWEEQRKSDIRRRFRRLIGLVRCLRRFINSLEAIAGDPKLLFKGIQKFLQSRKLSNRPEEFHRQSGDDSELEKDKKKVKCFFDVSKYKVSEQNRISLEIRLILSKPYFKRTYDEVKKVVESLQRVRSFVEYPVFYQHQLAKVAWLIEIPKNKLIIRQRHQAVDFYFLVSGRATIDRLEGSPDITEDSEFRNLGNLEAGKSFGEECMSDPYCDREYSVLSKTACQLISINIDDFANMLLVREVDEEAPEHIRYLCTLPFLDNFPKMKLLTKALDNIHSYYFTDGILLAEDLKTSKYVFVVRQGFCTILTEIKPSPEAIARHKQAEAEKERRAALQRSKRSHHEMTVTSLMSSFKREISETAKDAYRSRSMCASLFHDANLDEVVQKDMDKRQAEIERYRNLILAESKAVYEKSLHLCKNLPRKKRNKMLLGTPQKPWGIGHIPKTLPPASTQHESKVAIKLPSLSETIDSESMETFSSSDYSDYHHETPFVQEKQKSRRPPLGPDTSKLDPSTVRLSRGSSHAKKSLVALSAASIDSSTEMQRNSRISFSLDGGQLTPTNKKGRSSILLGSNIDLRDAVYGRPQPTDSKASYSDSTAMSEIPCKKTLSSETADTSESAPVFRRKRAFGERQDMQSQQRHQLEYSKWKLEKTLTNGDTVGTEYLDYNCGPFSPPTEKRSLISNGAYIIMIRRDFLLKYLRKEW